MMQRFCPMKGKSRKHTGATKPQRVGTRGEPVPMVDEEEALVESKTLPAQPPGFTPSAEAAGRSRGYEAGGGHSGNDLLEDGQLRGVDDEGNVVGGMHGGPSPRRPQLAPRRHGRVVRA